MALSPAAAAKIAASVLTSEKLRKTVGWIIAAILSPLILLLVVVCSFMSGGADHNAAVLDLCYYGGMVDEIVDELARDARVAEAYRLWYDIRTDIVSTYQDEMPELPPLSRQKEFKPISNMVVTEAAKLLGHESTFEEAPSDKQKAPENVRKLVKIIHARESTPDAVRDAAAMLLRLANSGNQDAEYAFGKLFLQGDIVRKDIPEAVRYFTDAAESGNANAMSFRQGVFIAILWTEERFTMAPLEGPT